MKLIQRLSRLPLKENYDLRVIKFVYNQKFSLMSTRTRLILI